MDTNLQTVLSTIPKKLLTLCTVHQHPRVLLGMKKRGFGEGRWNGFGGKVGKDETIEEAVRRKIRKEAGIEVNDLEKTGIMTFCQFFIKDIY